MTTQVRSAALYVSLLALVLGYWLLAHLDGASAAAGYVALVKILVKVERELRQKVAPPA